MNVTAFNFGFYSYNNAGQLDDLSNMDVDYTDNEADESVELDDCENDNDAAATVDDDDAFNTTLSPEAAANIPKLLLTSTPHRHALASSARNELFKNDVNAIDAKLDENDNELQALVVPQVQRLSLNEIETKLHKPAAVTHVSSDSGHAARTSPSPTTATSPTQFDTLFVAQTKLWSNELRAKTLQMAKLNSACQGSKATLMRQQMESNFMQKLEHIVAAAAITATDQQHENFQRNHLSSKTFGQAPLNDAHQSHANHDIKDKISFFNSITLAPTDEVDTPALKHNSSKFLTLLRSNKVTNQATIKTISTPTVPISTFPSFGLSSEGNAANQLLTPNNAANNAATAASVLELKSQNNFVSTHFDELSQRKNSSFRSNNGKTPLEKIRCNGISRQNANSISGTKPHMHLLMEDLSLVVPVQLRIAEYERRINSENYAT